MTPLNCLPRRISSLPPPGIQTLAEMVKTLQMNNSVQLLKIPSLGASPLCLLSAIRKLLKDTPKGPNKPLFQIKYKENWVPLSDTRLSKHFSLILHKLNLHTHSITFHSLHRSGATLAFNSNVSLQNIQRHGSWMSDCGCSYITQDHQASDTVALAFKNLLYK